MSNKLKIEDTCLTVEQSKELKSLGIEMKDTLMVFCDYYDQVHDYELCINWKGATDYVFEAVPTLTNTEMLEILPDKYSYHAYEDYHLDISVNGYSQKLIAYRRYWNDIKETRFHNNLLRDSLFEMIKYLKTNNLM